MSKLDELEFVECDTCKAKPGMPVLCWGCLKNRQTIEKLKLGKLEEREAMKRVVSSLRKENKRTEKWSDDYCIALSDLLNELNKN